MKKLIWLLLVSSAFAQSFITVTASNILNGSTSKLPAGQIIFQATGTNQQPISYMPGGGGQQILAPTTCSILNGAIVQPCSVANVLLTQPQNICFSVTVKNSSGQIVLGSPRNSGYQCVQPVPNNASWCTTGSCNFDAYPPNLPSPVLVINMPYPSSLTLGGVFAQSCGTGLSMIGINSLGQPVCGPGGSEGGGVWGTITGTLSNQLDLWAYLQGLAPLASPAFGGVPTVPEPSIGDNSTTIANTVWVRAQNYAPVNSPAFTGLPTAPTVSLGDSSTSLATTAWVQGQNYSVGAGNVTGAASSSDGDVVLFNGTSGKAIKDSAFGFPLAPSHIGTLVAGSNGLASSATTDTTNATNITSGTLPTARLPLPTSTTLGGVRSYAAVAHQWINSISTSGVPAGSQPACSDLSGAAPSCNTDTTNASNITTGTLAIARLGTLVAGQNGLAASATTDTTNATNIILGTLSIARLGTLVAGSNGLAASATTDTTNASNISSGTLAGARMSATNLAASGNGGVTGNLPFSQVSGTGNIMQAVTFVTLTDAATITWAVGSSPLANAGVTLGGNRTLNVTGLLTGGTYTLKVIQDATGSRSLTLGTGCTWKVSNGGGGTITPTAAANAVDVLAFIYDGTNCYANFAHNFN